jgi:hypothetical protein
LWVRIPSRLLTDSIIVPLPSGQGPCLTNRLAQVRVLPGRLRQSVRRCSWRHASLVGRWTGFDSRADLGERECWAAGPTERRLVCTQEIGVRLPGRSTELCSRRGTTGSSSNGTTPPWRGGDPGSTPGESIAGMLRKVAGYGWPGPGANGCARKGVRVRLPCLPLRARVTRSRW